MADDEKIADVYVGRYKPMKDAPKDGTAILALLDGSDIPLPIRWRGQGDTMAKKGPGWYVTWDGHALQPADGPRGWLPIPTEWLPETETEPSPLTLESAPIGTKAPACIGGHWHRTERGWKWHTERGCTYHRPGGDWTGELILPGGD